MLRVYLGTIEHDNKHTYIYAYIDHQMFRSHDGAGVDVLVVEHVHVLDLGGGGIRHGLRGAADEARGGLLVVGAADVRVRGKRVGHVGPHLRRLPRAALHPLQHLPRLHVPRHRQLAHLRGHRHRRHASDGFGSALDPPLAALAVHLYLDVHRLEWPLLPELEGFLGLRHAAQMRKVIQGAHDL